MTTEPYSMPNSSLIQSNLEADEPSRVFGNIDSLDEHGLRGWVADLNSPHRPIQLQVRLNDNVVATIANSQLRDDVSAALRQNIATGFAIDWSDKRLFDFMRGPGSAMFVPGTSISITIESPLHQRQIDGQRQPIDGEKAREWIEKAQLRVNARARAEASLSHITPRSIEKYFSGFDAKSIGCDSVAEDVKLVAFYLPQFHPIPENDEWWGKGFTEWTNASQGRPYFPGHYQPHLPGELGFYDLRLEETRVQQAKLARQYGIYGFCYYYYWFSGRRLLETPLQLMLDSGKPDFPFCLCWANENWSRRWDGSESEVLVEQLHNEESDIAFIKDVIPLFEDQRYIRLNGAPLLIIYRASLLPDPLKTTARWRQICRDSGIPAIHLCLAETFAQSEPLQLGFDSSVQFPPHGVVAPLENDNVPGLAPGFSGNIHDIKEVIADQFSRRAPNYKRFPGVMTSWDNTARKKSAGNVFINGTPENYEVWLRGAIDQARERLPEGERLVFINAWNEWAEGAHLEPDLRYGRAFLEATRRAAAGAMDWRQVVRYAEGLDSLAGPAKEWVLSSLRTALEKQAMTNRRLQDQFANEQSLPFHLVAQAGEPHWMKGLPVAEGGFACTDQINTQLFPVPPVVAVSTRQKMLLAAWAFFPPLHLARDTISYLVFKPSDALGTGFFSILPERVNRTDVRDHFSTFPQECTMFSGFQYYMDVSAIEPGSYRLFVAHRGDGVTQLVSLNQEIHFD